MTNVVNGSKHMDILLKIELFMVEQTVHLTISHFPVYGAQLIMLIHSGLLAA